MRKQTILDYILLNDIINYNFSPAVIFCRLCLKIKPAEENYKLFIITQCLGEEGSYTIGFLDN